MDKSIGKKERVVQRGFEPPASRLSAERTNQAFCSQIMLVGKVQLDQRWLLMRIKLPLQK